MAKYFLYARKSTEDDDRQVLSIEAQRAELKEFAAKEKLEIVASLCEAKTAKEPGRAKLGEMLNRIENGEADGIIAWHPDRLARNPIDGGKIIYLVDTGKIESLKFPTFWFEDTPQGKFMLNIAFGQSKYYVDNLSENVKRGFRQKLRRGEYPGHAPIGYLNDLKSHSIVVDPEKNQLVHKMFDLYSTGEHTLLNLTKTINELGLRSQREKPLTLSMVHRMLKNSFYISLFTWQGEVCQGTHEPIISKELFDKVQAVMRKRGYPEKSQGHNFTFTGLMKCPCGCAITAETKKGHIYYRCTKKKGLCDSKYTREEHLVEQFKATLQKASIPDAWADNMILEIEKEKQEAIKSTASTIDSLNVQSKTINDKLDKLLDSHLEGVIDKSDYLAKKNQLINQKVQLEDNIKQTKSKGNNWLEPMRDFILTSKLAKKVAQEGDLTKIKTFLKNIGSNFILKDKKIEFLADFGWKIILKNGSIFKWQGRRESNPALREGRENPQPFL